MSKKQKKVFSRIIISFVLMLILHFFPSKGVLRFLLYMVPYLIIGHDVLRKAFLGIKNKQILDENFLMAIATVGAIVIAVLKNGDYTEAVAVMLFYQTGELFQSCAVGKSRKNICALMDIRPDYANVLENGSVKMAEPSEVEIGSIIVVNPGEKVPLDGVIVEGKSSLDMAALTGESVPKEVKCGDSITSGAINMTGVLKIETTKEFGESTVSKILDLVENASFRKAKSENFIAKFARVYTPLVCLTALALAVIPPFISLLIGADALFSVWFYRALTFLVVSCPCALVISIPLTFFAGIGGASREGILIKGSNYLETLSKTDCVVFDKTGTLTKGVFEVEGIYHTENKEILLEYAALAESASSHPISKSIKSAYGKEIDLNRVGDIKEISGKGIIALIDGKKICVGNEKLMEYMGIKYEKCNIDATCVYVSVEESYSGCIVISDKIKDNSKIALKKLKDCGIKNTVMLTGDNKSVAKEVAKELGIGDFYADLLPQDKVSILEKLMKNNKGTLCFVGDGINDAPVLTRADIGIAMGGVGSDAAIEAADIVLMDDDPIKIPKAIKISKKCLKIVWQNCVFAIGIKFLCLIFAAFGIANMWLAIFADVGVMIIAVLNAIRALYVKNL